MEDGNLPTDREASLGEVSEKFERGVLVKRGFLSFERKKKGELIVFVVLHNFARVYSLE